MRNKYLKPSEIRHDLFKPVQRCPCCGFMIDIASVFFRQHQNESITDFTTIRIQCPHCFEILEADAKVNFNFSELRIIDENF